MSDRMKDVTRETGCAELGGAWRYPTGLNVPSYLTEPKCGRFYINSDKGNDYGTKAQSPSWLYALDGNRMVPGHDPEHLGGDAWAADAAITMMEKENWSGMLVTMGGIDKAGHMWGAYHDDGGKPGSADEQTHLPFVAKYADEQFGRILSKLKELGQLDETLIIITADHGATYAKEFHGNDAVGGGDYNWYYGKTVNSEDYNKPSPALKPLIDTGNVQLSYQSTSIQTWLKDNSPAKKHEAAKIMRTLPGVAATYWRDGDHFTLDAAPGQGTAATLSATELAWWKKHGQELVDTMAADNGPDIIGLLADEVGYGVKGDHGSAKQSDQRVPMVVWAANIQAEQPAYAFRTVDILPTVLKAMGIRQDQPGDGKAYSLKFR
ncbi:sulfatase-like hydrolase/transferase [Undibacterium arcticum]